MRMTRGEFDVVCSGRLDYAIAQRRWNDTIIAGVILTMRGVAGVSSSRDECLCYSYPDEPAPSEPMSDNEVVDVMKQWVVATGGKTF